MNTSYRPAGTSAFDRTNTPTTCGCCGRENLKTTVKMVDPAGAIVWMGTGCAAKAMSIGVKEFKAQAKEADAAATIAAELERRARQEAEEAAWDAFLLEAAGPGDRTDQIARLGGFAAARAAYKETRP